MTATETIDPRHIGLDSWADETILGCLLDGQKRAVSAVESALAALADAARAIASRLGETGRIVYVGAGSSGTIAAFDGIELGGTFGWPDERIAFVLASGDRIAPLAGGAEDDADGAQATIAALDLTSNDAVIAVSASGTTPFTLAAVAEAETRGVLSVGVSSNRNSPLLKLVDIPVFLDSGPEVIVGSTRMGAGTAQKAALNLISTLAMIRLGHVYDGLMVNLRADNHKLRQRAVRMLRAITGCAEEDAAAALSRCAGRVKPAALVIKGIAPAEADRILDASGGNLRSAFARLN